MSPPSYVHQDREGWGSPVAGHESVISPGFTKCYWQKVELGIMWFIYLKFAGKDIVLWSARNVDEWPKLF